ncbi:MAG: CapA family protein, partial [Ferruginibacter sp.]
MNPINLNIAGDLFLGRRVETIAINNPDSLFDNEIKKLFSASDFNIVNLESPLTNAGNKYKILKTGPNLKAAPETVGVLKSMNTTLVTLANNHSYDFGDKGI